MPSGRISKATCPKGAAEELSHEKVRIEWALVTQAGKESRDEPVSMDSRGTESEAEVNQSRINDCSRLRQLQ